MASIDWTASSLETYLQAAQRENCERSYGLSHASLRSDLG
jgi:hypothetical protein